MPPSGLWSEPQSRWHINRLDLEAVFLTLKDFRPQLEQQHVLIRTDNKSVVSYIHHQGGVRSKSLYKQAANLLLWTDHHFLTIRAAHISGLLNRGADMLLRKGIPHGEWRLHPESVRMIWNRYRRADVECVRHERECALPAVLLSVLLPAGGRCSDIALASSQAVRVSSDIAKILPLVLCKIREEGASVFPDLTELLVAPPWPIPIRKDLLSQASGLWSFHVWLLWGYHRS